MQQSVLPSTEKEKQVNIFDFDLDFLFELRRALQCVHIYNSGRAVRSTHTKQRSHPFMLHLAQ